MWKKDFCAQTNKRLQSLRNSLYVFCRMLEVRDHRTYIHRNGKRNMSTVSIKRARNSLSFCQSAGSGQRGPPAVSGESVELTSNLDVFLNQYVLRLFFIGGVGFFQHLVFEHPRLGTWHHCIGGAWNSGAPSLFFSKIQKWVENIQEWEHPCL